MLCMETITTDHEQRKKYINSPCDKVLSFFTLQWLVHVIIIVNLHIDLSYLELLAEEEAMLQGMIGRPTEIGRCCGLEINMRKN